MKTCGRRLYGEDPQPKRRQVFELPKVEPTNNTAERAVYRALILRQIGGGMHSLGGSRFTERILTVHLTEE